MDGQVEAARDARRGRLTGRGHSKSIVSKSIGQALVGALIRDLLGLREVPLSAFMEKTPKELKEVESGGFKFERVVLDIYLTPDLFKRHEHLKTLESLEIIIEVQGSQHERQDHPFHRMRDAKMGVSDSFQRMVASDQFKRDYVASKPDVRKLIEVPYPDNDRNDLRRLLDRAIDLLEAQLPLVREVVGYEERKARVRSPVWVTDCLSNRHQERLAAARTMLAEGGRPELVLQGFDLTTDTAQILCTKHSPAVRLTPTHWNNLRNNAFGCQVCQHEATGDRKRLPFDEVVERAARYGFRPNFDATEYRNDDQSLPWTCLVAGHEVTTRPPRLAMGCASCQAACRDAPRQAELRAKVLQVVENAGDSVKSSLDSIVSLSSVLSVSCGDCGKVTQRRVSKIIHHQQRCQCGRGKGAVASKKKRADQEMVSVLAGLGIQIMSVQRAESGKHRDTILELREANGATSRTRVSALQQRKSYQELRREISASQALAPQSADVNGRDP